MLLVRQLFLLTALETIGGFVPSKKLAQCLDEIDAKYWKRKDQRKRFTAGMWKNLVSAEKSGLIKSRTELGRGRAGVVRLWSITPKGRTEVNKVFEAYGDVAEGVFGSVSE